MGEKILIGLIGAIIALFIKEALDLRKKKNKGKKIATLAIEHLKIFKKDIEKNIKIKGERAHIGETQYCEIAGADFIYSHISSNLECFESIESIKKTIVFFHHYKINMNTIKARLDNTSHKQTVITEGTYRNLVSYLDEAIAELENISSQ